MASPSPIHDMLGELRKEGRETLRGGFTLDREKAREKMSAFSLADPRSYVLELVQAAVLMQDRSLRSLLAGASEAGASEDGALLATGVEPLRFAIDSDDMHLRFGGEPFTVTDFDLIYASLFTGGNDRRSRARRQLALGLNAALALNPRYVRVVSGDEHGSAVLEMRPGQPDHFEKRDEPAAGTHVHVKSRFRPGLVVQFYRNVAGTIAEEVLLAQRCERSFYPVVLEGRQLAAGLALPEAPDRVVIPSEGVVLGFVGFVPGGDSPAQLRIYKDGVHITTHPRSDLPRGLVAVVDAEPLRKDVSQANVVINAAYQEVVERVRQAARIALAAMGRRLLDEAEGGEPDPHRAWLWERLRDAVLEVADTETLCEAAESELDHVLLRLPFWQSIDGRWWSLEHILAECEDAEVGWTEKTYAEHLPALDRLFISDAPIILYLPEEPHVELFRRLFAVRFTRQTEGLDRLLEREENRRLWRSRRMEPALSALDGAPRHISSHRVETPELRCEVGLPLHRTEGFDLCCVVDGHLLCKRSVAGDFPGVMAGITSVVEGGLRPDPMYADVVADDGLAEALLATVCGMRGAFDRCARGWFQARRRSPAPEQREQDERRASFLSREPSVRALVLDYLALVLAEDFPDSLFAAFDLEADADTVAHLEVLGPWRPPFVAHPPEATEAVPPYDRLPLFATVSGDWLSLVALRHWVQEQGELRWVPEEQAQDPDCDVQILWLSPTALGLLTAVFGAEVLREDKVGYRVARKEAIHLRKRPEPVSVRERRATFCVVHYRAGSMEGELGMYVRVLEPMATWELRLLRKFRPLVTRRTRLNLPAGAAVINSDELVPTSEWDDVLEGPGLAAARLVLRRAAQQLVVYMATRLPDLSDENRARIRELIRNALRGWFPPELVDTFAVLRRGAEDDERAVALYEELLRPLGAVDPQTLAPLLASAMTVEGALPEPSLIFVQLPEDVWPLELAEVPLELDFSGSDSRWFLPESAKGRCRKVEAADERALRPLLEVPVFEAGQGVFVSPWELLLRTAGGKPIHYVHRHWTEEVEVDEQVLLVSGVELDLLRALLGEDLVQHGGVLLQAAAQRKRFLAREVVDSLALESGVALVWLPLDVDGIQGQVGLAAVPEEGSWIDLHQERRYVCRNQGFTRPGLVATVNDDQLTTKRDYTYVDKNDRLQLVYDRCEELREPLLMALAEQWDAVDALTRGALTPLMLEQLAERLGGGYAQGEPPGDAVGARLAALPMLEGIGGVWHSLDDLRVAFAQTGAVDYLMSEREGELLDPSQVVLLLNRRLTLHLKSIFGSLRDYAPRWDDDQVMVALAHHGAPALPEVESKPGLLHTEFRLSPWGGYIYLPADPTTELSIRFGVRGVEAFGWQPSLVFPCAGRFDTDKVRVYRRRQRGTLSDAQVRILERQACSLYQSLASRFRSRELQGDARDAACVYLRHVVARLHGLVRRDTQKELNRYWRNLYGRLLGQPLFPLASGERVSLEAALELRPPELAPYGLWSDGGATEGADGLTIARTRVFSHELEAEAPPAEVAPVLAPPTETADEKVPSEAAQLVDALAAETALFPRPMEDFAKAPVLDGEPEPELEPEVEVEEGEPGAPWELEQVEELSAEERLVQALREELKAQHTEENRLLDDVPLRSITLGGKGGDSVATCDDMGIVIQRKHPVVQALLDDAEAQPLLLSMLALGVYTAVNLYLEEVTDDHEAQFQHLLVERLRQQVFEAESG